MIGNKSCVYCCEDIDEVKYLMTDGVNGIYIDGNGNLCGDEICFEDVKLYYCPKCGRKLNDK